MSIRSQGCKVSRRESRGFTLLEVVVALAVLAMTLGVIYETLGWSLRRSEVSQQKEVALLRAQSLLSQVRAQPGILRPGKRNDTTSDTRSSIDVREHASQVSAASSIVPLEVIVTVQWGAKNGEQIQLSSIELARRTP